MGVEIKMEEGVHLVTTRSNTEAVKKHKNPDSTAITDNI